MEGKECLHIAVPGHTELSAGMQVFDQPAWGHADQPVDTEGCTIGQRLKGRTLSGTWTMETIAVNVFTEHVSW